MNKKQIIAILIVVLSVSAYCGLMLTHEEESPKTNMSWFYDAKTGEFTECMYIQDGEIVITTEVDKCKYCPELLK